MRWKRPTTWDLVQRTSVYHNAYAARYTRVMRSHVGNVACDEGSSGSGKSKNRQTKIRRDNNQLDIQHLGSQSTSHCRIQRQIVVRRFVAHTPKTHGLDTQSQGVTGGGRLGGSPPPPGGAVDTDLAFLGAKMGTCQRKGGGGGGGGPPAPGSV